MIIEKQMKIIVKKEHGWNGFSKLQFKKSQIPEQYIEMGRHL